MPVFSRSRCSAAARHALLILTLGACPAYAEMVFSAKVRGPVSNIYALDDSGALRRLTDNIRWRDIEPDIAADGAVVFASNREADARMNIDRRSENFNIFLVPPGGGEPRAVTSSGRQDLSPRFSPDGRHIAFLRRGGNSSQLLLAGRRGGSERVLAEAVDILDYGWAPDGARLALALRRNSEYQLAIISLAGEAAPTDEILLRSRELAPVAVSWSPDGRRIAYVRHPLEGGERSLWLRELATGNERRLSGEGQEVQAAPAWSSDGERLLYSALVDYRFQYDERAHRKTYRGGMQIFTAGLRGNSRQLTDGEALHRAPRFYPDESRIAYLYGNRLDARSLSLRSANIADGGIAPEMVRELFDGVAQRSNLRWR